jgi:structural hemagglutinin/hemolysin toxin protein RtxA
MRISALDIGKNINIGKVIFGIGVSGAFSLIGINNVLQRKEIRTLQEKVQEVQEMEKGQHVISLHVPEDDVEKVKEIMFKAGAGRVGNYGKCAWQTLGEGQFVPLLGSDPYKGEQGKVERVKEYRVEMFCDNDSLKKVITALKEEKDGHPYETISVYIYKNAATWITKKKKEN